MINRIGRNLNIPNLDHILRPNNMRVCCVLQKLHLFTILVIVSSQGCVCINKYIPTQAAHIKRNIWQQLLKAANVVTMIMGKEHCIILCFTRRQANNLYIILIPASWKIFTKINTNFRCLCAN